jgi:hypothetical protein
MATTEMNFGRRDSQQQLLSLLATHGKMMLFITCKRLAQWHHLNLQTRKQDDQWVACITPADFLIDKEWSLTTIKDMLIQQSDIATTTWLYSRHDGVQQRVIKRTKEVSEKKRRSLDS